MNFVFIACTKEYPEGCACEVVKLLMKKHQPKDTLSTVELLTENEKSSQHEEWKQPGSAVSTAVCHQT